MQIIRRKCHIKMKVTMAGNDAHNKSVSAGVEYASVMGVSHSRQ